VAACSSGDHSPRFRFLFDLVDDASGPFSNVVGSFVISDQSSLASLSAQM
jgi:hypothetical protein